MAARTPGPDCHTDAQRKTASRSSSATEEIVNPGNSRSSPTEAKTTRTAAG